MFFCKSVLRVAPVKVISSGEQEWEHFMTIWRVAVVYVLFYPQVTSKQTDQHHLHWDISTRPNWEINILVSSSFRSGLGGSAHYLQLYLTTFFCATMTYNVRISFTSWNSDITTVRTFTSHFSHQADTGCRMIHSLHYSWQIHLYLSAEILSSWRTGEHHCFLRSPQWW